MVSDAGQNLRLNPNNGAVAGVDTALAFAAGDANAGQNPNLVGSAYTNNFAGSTSTTLYGIDSNRDALVTQGSLQAAIFASDDLDSTFEKVRASGAEVLQEPASQPWGARDCAFRDPSGNLVRIAQA